MALSSPVHVVSHTAAQILGAFGAVDVPLGEWPELISTLLGNVVAVEISQSIKVASLEVMIIETLAILFKRIEPIRNSIFFSSSKESLRRKKRKKKNHIFLFSLCSPPLEQYFIPLGAGIYV